MINLYNVKKFNREFWSKPCYCRWMGEKAFSRPLISLSCQSAKGARLCQSSSSMHPFMFYCHFIVYQCLPKASIKISSNFYFLMMRQSCHNNMLISLNVNISLPHFRCWSVTALGRLVWPSWASWRERWNMFDNMHDMQFLLLRTMSAERWLLVVRQFCPHLRWSATGGWDGENCGFQLGGGGRETLCLCLVFCILYFLFLILYL